MSASSDWTADRHTGVLVSSFIPEVYRRHWRSCVWFISVVLMRGKSEIAIGNVVVVAAVESGRDSVLRVRQ